MSDRELLDPYKSDGLVILAFNIILLDAMQVIRPAPRDRRAADINDHVLLFATHTSVPSSPTLIDLANFLPVDSARSWTYQSAVDFRDTEKGIIIAIGFPSCGKVSSEGSHRGMPDS